MADTAPLYPPTPKNIPRDLTRSTGDYRWRVVLVLASLVLFLIVYLGLTLGSAYLSYWCFASLGKSEGGRTVVVGTDLRGRPISRFEPGRPPVSPVVAIPGGIASGLLCLFLVKGLFKRGQKSTAFRVEVTEEEQPHLFAFIRQLCKDVRAPFPNRVFLVPDVTAAVAFEESLLNLILPSKKNLIIGLGLVNRLNLTEFKAVLAHEFGHFSQNSMALGSYVYTSNRVIADVVYGRDWLDDAVAAAGRIDIRISVFVWAFAGTLWTVRKGLHFLFRGINFANTSLSRQMEYNADLVAVSVTGSDPLVFALAKLDFAADSLGSAWADLMAAADHGRYTRDIYYHHAKAAEHLKEKRGDVMLGEVPALPDDPTRTVRVFKPEDTSVPKMWATHPANVDREANAKAQYFRGPTDDRPAWVLFSNHDGVKKRMAYESYKANRKEKIPELEDPEEIQAFLDAEHAETTYPPQYHGLYENRYVRPGDPRELMSSAKLDYDAPEKVVTAHALLLRDDLFARMEAHRKRLDDKQRLTGIAGGFVALVGRDFEFRGRRYEKDDAARLQKKVEKEIDEDFEWMHKHDRLSFRVHYAMAWQLGGDAREEFEQRYSFHLAAQLVHMQLAGATNEVNATLGALAGQRQVPPEEFQHAVAVLREARQVVRKQLDAADDLRLPPLSNMKPGARLGAFLFKGRLVRSLDGDTTTIDGKWVGDLMAQTGEIMDKAARILFKSLGAILQMQDRIAADWHARQSAGTLPADPDGDRRDPDALPLAPDEPDEAKPKPKKFRDDYRK